jgi:predicted nucleotidyltransferase component of viral defense system
MAMWRAVGSLAREVTTAWGVVPNNLPRQFLYARFLARVFVSSDGRWVLKGGTAMLARVRSARHSADLDFVLTDGSLDTAVAELRVAAAVDLHDHLTFALVGEPVRRDERPGQPGSELVTVKVQSYAGAKKLDQFSVDVVTNSVITQTPDEFVPDLAITLPGMTTPVYRVYPVVDHIADKVCATIELHNGVPSSRARDLVDLVVFARTHDVVAEELRTAIRAEEDHRQLPRIRRWECPPTWERLYPPRTVGVSECRGYETLAAASALMSRFLDPLLADDLGPRRRWSAAGGAWEDPTTSS